MYNREKIVTILFLISLAVLFPICIDDVSAANTTTQTTAVVTNQFANTVTIIDISSTPQIKSTLNVGNQPNGVDITPDSQKALVTSVDNSTISVINLTAETPFVSDTINIPKYNGYGLASIDISPDGNIAAVTYTYYGPQAKKITLLNMTSNTPQIIKDIYVGYYNGAYIFGEANDVAITLDNKYALVTVGGYGKGVISVVDLSSMDEIYTIDLGAGYFPICIGMDPTGRFAVVTNLGDNSAYIIDLTTSPFTIKAVVPVGKNPGAKPAITADGKYAVVAASDNGTVSIIDLTLSIPTVVKTIYVGGYPRGVAIIDDIALIACRSTYYIQEIDLNTFNVIGSFFANYSPSKIAISRPTAANNDPVAVNDTVTTFEDMFVMISVLVNDFDADGDALTVTGVTDPEHGSITWTPDGIIKYTPDENYYGTDTFTYTITDGELTAIATVTVTITPMNDAPVAVAGSDQVVDKVTTVYLDGTQSYDPDGESLTYQWEFLSKPIGSNAVLSGANTARPTFEPDLKGEYVIQLTVTDSWNETSSSLVKVCFRNLQPVADIVTASSVMVGETVTLDGSGSSDMNGDALSYQWSFLSVPVGSQATIASPQAMVTSFVPDLPGTYIVQLIVNDGNIDSQPVIAMIQVTSPIIEVIESIENTENIVISLDSAVFKTDNMQNALLNKLSSVMWEIKAGDYKGVLSKLQNDILKKTDGYMTIGAPDKNDWIQDRETQVILYYSILEIIENLKKLL